MDAIAPALSRYRSAMGTLTRALAEAQQAADVLAARLTAASVGVQASPRVTAIQTVVAEHFGYTRERLLRRERTAGLALARQTAMTLCRGLLNLPLVSVGLQFGGMDHGTVQHACRAVRDRLQTDAEFAAIFAELTHKARAALAPHPISQPRSAISEP